MSYFSVIVLVCDSISKRIYFYRFVITATIVLSDQVKKLDTSINIKWIDYTFSLKNKEKIEYVTWFLVTVQNNDQHPLFDISSLLKACYVF